MGTTIQEVVKNLNELQIKGANWILASDQAILSFKSSKDKWSKKEILGNLIDSALNNLRRFTEIQFEEKPYRIASYNQDELVSVNHYQFSETKELLDLWTSLNNRITLIISDQSQEIQGYDVSFADGTTADMRSLMTDYVNHMAHHLN